MAARLNELKQGRIEARKRGVEAKAALSKLLREHSALAEAEKRLFSAEEKLAQAKLENAIKEADEEQLRFEEQLAAEERRLDAVKRGEGCYPVPGAGPSHPEGTLAAGVGRKFADLFGPPASMLSQGWTSRGEFFQHLAAGVHHPALVPAAAFMRESVGSDGGFLVPEELTVAAFDGALEDEPVLRMVTIEPMMSGVKRVAGFASKNHQSSGPFGFSGGWVGEGATIAAEKALVRSLKLEAKKLALLVQASTEVASDGLGFDVQLEGAMRSALGWLLADAVFTGTGAGQPQGVLVGPAKVVQAKEAGPQTADTIVYANIVNMLSRLLPSSMSRAAFFASHTTRPELMKLSVPIGTAGTFIPLVLGADGIYRLLGIPLYFTEHLPVLGDQGDIVLGDFSQYVLGIRSQITLDRSAHVGFSQDLQTYRGIVRADGQSKHDAPFQPKNGSTQAPFVVLEAR